MNILLCTDNLMTRAQLEDTWRKAGAELISAGSRTMPDLILVDLTLDAAPAIIEALRTDYPGTELLVFGPHVDGDAFKQARNAGATSQVSRGKVVDRVLKQLKA